MGDSLDDLEYKAAMAESYLENNAPDLDEENAKLRSVIAGIMDSTEGEPIGSLLWKIHLVCAETLKFYGDGTVQHD